MELFYNHQQLTSEHSIYISMKFPNHFQGLHFLESNRKKRVSIDDVKIDDLNCVKSIHVTQSYIEK